MRRPVTLGLRTFGKLAFVVVLVAIGTLLFVMSRQTVADITVENRSGESVVSGEVEFLGDTYPFSRIDVDQTAHISFRVRGEGGYRIRARLESGKELNSTEGVYLASGGLSDMQITDVAELTTDGIAVRRVSVGALSTAR